MDDGERPLRLEQSGWSAVWVRSVQRFAWIGVCLWHGCAMQVSDFAVRLAFLFGMQILAQFASRVSDVPLTHNVVAIENGACFVA